MRRLSLILTGLMLCLPGCNVGATVDVGLGNLTDNVGLALSLIGI
jgi:hypothetical protein